MNIKNIKYVAAAMLLTVGMTSCDDFLDRPVEDNYNTENYYTDDASCVRGVNYLYNSPWYDFQRAFIKIGEVMSGNMYWGSSPYMNFSLNGTDQDLVNMSYSLWAEIGHSNTVYNSIKGSSCSESVKNQCMGECLAWKAMAYFYLVRTFRDVPYTTQSYEDDDQEMSIPQSAPDSVLQCCIADLEESFWCLWPGKLEERRLLHTRCRLGPARRHLSLACFYEPQPGRLSEVY